MRYLFRTIKPNYCIRKSITVRNYFKIMHFVNFFSFTIVVTMIHSKKMLFYRIFDLHHEVLTQ
jgi:hypothetical protein